MARRRRRKHRKQGLSPAVLIAGAAAAALAVLLIALFTVRGCSVRQTGAGVPDTAALPETGQESLQPEMETLSQGERIEIRGFGSFEVRLREPRIAHNPKTGERVDLPARKVVHFKPGVELRNRVNS